MRRIMGLFASLLLGLTVSIASAAPQQGDHGGEHHVPTFDDVNWFYGLLGEKEGVEPSLLWREPGQPVPVLALVINSLILFGLLYRFGKQPIMDGLRSRKNAILKGMDEAARLKKDAEARLAEYEHKLAHIQDEVDRVHRELRETGEHERARILAEAKERRARMEREARLLIEQELKAVRELLLKETVRGALRTAEEDLRAKITPADQQRLAEEYLASLKKAAPALRGKL